MEIPIGAEQLISPFPQFVSNVSAQFVEPHTYMTVQVCGERGSGNLVVSSGGMELAVPVVVFREPHIGSFAVRLTPEGTLIPNTTVVQGKGTYQAVESPILLLRFD